MLKTLTPFISKLYAQNQYSQEEINELRDLLLNESELRRYNKMKGDTPKQAFLAISTLVDLSLISNK